MDVLLHAGAPETERRDRIFRGAIYLDPPDVAACALADFARELTERAFHPMDPAKAQWELPVERFVDIIAALKTEFTNHERTKELVCALLRARGCDPEETYFDVPRLRVVTAGGYLRAGVGYAYRPHRDTWYAAPDCQVNWWMALADLEPEQALVFYPRFFTTAIENTSSDFDYQAWRMCGRPQAKNMITYDSRNHPVPKTNPGAEDEVRLISGTDEMLTFSAAQLHATAENTTRRTRFSVDFRTFDRRDLNARRGAPNVDSASIGTTATDFLRVADGQAFTLAAMLGRHV